MIIAKLVFYGIGFIIVLFFAFNLIRAMVEAAEAGDWKAVLLGVAILAYIALGIYVSIPNGN